MSNTRAAEVLDQILADLKDLNKGPSDNVPVKTIWTRATQNGVSHSQDVTDALQLGVDQQLLTLTAGGPGGLGLISLTQAGFDKSRA